MNWSPLEKYLPENALQFLYHWLENEPVRIKLKPARRSKLGDYRYFRDTKSHEISVDRGLSKEGFFFVLTHEIAHLLVQKNFAQAKPHGAEWKRTFGNLLRSSIEVYPEELRPIILAHAKSPKASVGGDKNLRQALFLKEFEIEKLIENLPVNQKFRLGKRVFQKGAKRKIRYICKEVNTGKFYLINGQAIVDEILSE